jgi:hypothetical protein
MKIARRICMCPLPTDPGNASYALTWTAGQLTTIVKTIDGTAFTRTLGYDGDGNLDMVSVWS